MEKFCYYCNYGINNKSIKDKSISMDYMKKTKFIKQWHYSGKVRIEYEYNYVCFDCIEKHRKLENKFRKEILSQII